MSIQRCSKVHLKVKTDSCGTLSPEKRQMITGRGTQQIQMRKFVFQLTILAVLSYNNFLKA